MVPRSWRKSIDGDVTGPTVGKLPMKTYHIKIRTKSGHEKIGHMPASNEEALVAKLQAHGWTLLKILPDHADTTPLVESGIDAEALKGWLMGVAAIVILVVVIGIGVSSPNRDQPTVNGSTTSAEQALRLDNYQAVTTRVEEWRARGVPVSNNHESVSSVDNEAKRLWTAETAARSSPGGFPARAENGDVRGTDNDGDGRAEPVHVSGYTRSDGTYVREQYRALPSRSGSSSPPPSRSGGAVQVRGYTRKDGTYVAPHTRSAPRK